MNVLWDTLGFAGKGVIVFIVFAACTIVFFARAARAARAGQRAGSGRLRVRRINDILERTANALRGAMMRPKEAKAHNKALAKAEKTAERPTKNLFVLDFKGDMMATAVESLRHEVTALCNVVGEGDEVVVRLESGGGAMHSYGFAASQLDRLKQRGVALTVCVDRVAASGGYMMACVGQRIVAAPFAILGSIGVMSPVPNVHRLLDRFGIDYEDFTAGEFKRTVTPLGEITPQARKKYQEQLDDAHQLFKNFVSEHRPEVDIEKVATGETWHGIQAVDLGLVNDLMTSDDYLLGQVSTANIYRVAYQRPRNVRNRLASFVSAATGALTDGITDRLAEKLATAFAKRTTHQC